MIQMRILCSDEIAGCMERAYERLAFTEAARMLFFETQKQMKAYADKVDNVGL